MDLQKLRGEIDAIDTQMTDLFVRRMGLCAEVARYKKENGMAVVHQGREREILSRISALAGDELDSYARILFSTLFDLSRSYQSMLITEVSPVERKIDEALRSTPQMLPKKAVVACQGVEGGYAQQACDKVFSFADIMYFRSWEGVFSAVQKGLCQYGILPIENSSNGSVNGVYDLMRSFDFHIVRGVKLHVNHSLLACPGADLGGIKEIFSHEQAIGQCSEFLRTLPGVQITVCENTAMAAKLVAESGRTDAAAISSPACAAMYGLRELRQGVHNTDNNYTRFILIAKNPEIYPGADHLSLMFKVGHTPGSLTRVLARFSALGLNMTKLESRPISGADFHYMFYMDFEGSIYDPSVRKLLCELEQELELFVFLGAYQEE
ncbi:MAG: bifunctional chorismate mutase/prephenate dehydratase [Oscillospiraceae bacterium]|nr:bifunctional chorismate mutase/prephenate dehydratase [Oscillospiraceae bacterium]MCI9588769.1 bifunctional chorismate mutase/prephenate dehydratase [Oscillospiraceae bacterium]